MSAPDRPAIAEVAAGDRILTADGRCEAVALVRCIATEGASRVLYLERGGRACAVRYGDAEVVERHSASGQAAA